jgi:hypothetical protein
MPGLQLLEMPPGKIQRRVMFALELLDPVTGRAVRDGLKPSVAGLPAPMKGPGGRFVWLDLDPPAQRQISVDLVIDNRMYGPPDTPIQFTVEANDGKSDPAAFLHRHKLSITSNYVPPDGTTGATGMVVEDAATKAPLADLQIAFACRYAGNQVFVAARKAISDAGGAFSIFADDMGDIVPDPAPPTAAGGDISAWLEVTRPGNPAELRYTGFLPLPLGRWTQLRKALLWAELNNNPPP